MARTRNNQLIGAAAAAQKRDDLETVMTADAIARAQLRKRTMQACQYIADRIPPADYDAWWKTAPDDNEGFYRAAADKMSELEAAEVLEWLSPSPADYDTTDLPSPVIISGGEVLELSKTTNPDEEIPF